MADKPMAIESKPMPDVYTKLDTDTLQVRTTLQTTKTREQLLNNRLHVEKDLARMQASLDAIDQQLAILDMA